MMYYLICCLLWASWAAYMQDKHFGRNVPMIIFAFCLNFLLMPACVALATWNKIKYGSVIKRHRNKEE